MKKKVRVDTTSTRIGDDELPKNPFGDFMRADVVKDGDVVVIKSPAVVFTTRFGSHRVVQVLHGGKRYSLRLNRLSLKNLVDAWGSDSEDWVEKKAVIRLETVLGKTAIVLYPS